jgi:replicative DNA helicase
MLDITLIKLMKHRDEYYKLIKAIPMTAMDAKTQELINDFGKYFKKFPTHKVVQIEIFLPRFKAWHPTMSDDTFNAYVGVLRASSSEVDDATKAGILSDLYELDMGTKLANAFSQFDAGSLKTPLIEIITDIVSKYKDSIGTKTVQWIDTSIDVLLSEVSNNKGLKWRLDVLNTHMRPLRGGDFGILASRPDRGKTTMVASEITTMAKQLPNNKNAIWLNNEGPGKRLIPRIYQSALGCTVSELIAKNKAGTLKAEYIKAIGRIDKVRVVDIHGMGTSEITDILDNSNPGFVVADMLDHISGFRDMNRTDLQVEELYKWFRDKAVEKDCPILGTSQISGSGEGLMFPTMDMLKDSRTGKQGACDFIMMIGSSGDPGLQYARYISLPKNKLKLEGQNSDPRSEVKINPDINRYEDITE